jgi:integrase/recombinase XerD
MRLAEAIPSFLSHCGSQRRLSALTVSAYGADLRDFGAHVGADKVLTEISLDDLKGYLSHLNDHRTLTVATVRRRFATLQGLFKWATADESFENPFHRWRPKLRRPKRLPRALQRLELSGLLDTAQARSKRGAASEMTFLSLTLMAATGLRVGELCALSVEDMSPDGGTFRVHGKGSRDRVVFVSNEWLKELLAAWREVRVRSATGSEPLFVGRHGGQLNPAALRGRTKRLARAGGATRKVTPHMLRHTAATLLIEEGVDIRVVQRLLGHASIATTEIYTHVADETLRRSLAQADVIGRVVAKAKR